MLELSCEMLAMGVHGIIYSLFDRCLISVVSSLNAERDIELLLWIKRLMKLHLADISKQ